MEAGKYDNISLSEYHKMPGWSKTALDHINKSPAHYLEWLANPPEQTPAMAFGSALHCAVLTPELYEKSYCIAPIFDKRTTAGKAAYADFLKSSEGKTAIDTESAGKIVRMKNAIFAHPLAAEIFSNGEAEQSFFWTDAKTGLDCKARPDYFRNDGIVADLKSCSDASFKAFQRSVYNYRYHVQGAFFMDGIFQASKMDCTDFVLVAIESEAPFGIMVYRLDEMAIGAGKISYQENLATIKDWKEKPEFYKTVYPLSNSPIEMPLPAWAE